MDYSPTSLPNPVVYLNHLHPDVAFQYEVTRNIFITTLGAFIWDILSCVQQDWKLLWISKPQPVVFSYHLSRLSTLVFLTLCVLEYTGPIENCPKFQLATTIFCFLSASSSDFLFLVRICAVYYHKKYIRIIFVLFWVVDLVASWLVFTGIKVSSIANTKHCINSSKARYETAIMVIPLLFDTLVYIFIAAKLLSTRKPSEKKVTWMTIFSGESLPQLSHAIMQGNQQYYLIKVVSNVVVIAFWVIPSAPIVCRVAAPVPVTALTSSMACRVYRKLKLESVDQEPQTNQASTVNALLTTQVQVAHLSEVSSIRDVEAVTSENYNLRRQSVQIVEDDTRGAMTHRHVVDSV